MSGAFPWAQAVTIGTPIALGAITVIGTVWAKRMSKRTEDAGARKLHAEATQIEVATARGLVAEVKELMANQRADYEARLAATRAELASISERLKVQELRSQVLVAALAAHGPWDEAAYAALRTTTPGYPSPPPLNPNINPGLPGSGGTP
jgi:hypothetical protein